MEHIFKFKNDNMHTARLVFECAFCKTKFHVGQGYATIREMYDEIDKLLENGCHKCGGRIVFKSQSSE